MASRPASPGSASIPRRRLTQSTRRPRTSCRASSASPTPSAWSICARRTALAGAPRRSTRPPTSTRGSWRTCVSSWSSSRSSLAPCSTSPCCAAPRSYGYSDAQIALAVGTEAQAVEAARREFGIERVYKLVDTCAAEFEAVTPYYYSTYERETEVRTSDTEKIMILGGGPEPDRPGDRVRLLLRARRLRGPGDRVRGRDGQLEPRDRLHGLRHLGPPVLRAADPRGRHEHRPRGASPRGSSCSSEARRR